MTNPIDMDRPRGVEAAQLLNVFHLEVKRLALIELCRQSRFSHLPIFRTETAFDRGRTQAHLGDIGLDSNGVHALILRHAETVATSHLKYIRSVLEMYGLSQALLDEEAARVREAFIPPVRDDDVDTLEPAVVAPTPPAADACDHAPEPRKASDDASSPMSADMSAELSGHPLSGAFFVDPAAEASAPSSAPDGLADPGASKIETALAKAKVASARLGASVVDSEMTAGR